jgi:hypothetical protein
MARLPLEQIVWPVVALIAPLLLAGLAIIVAVHLRVSLPPAPTS